MSRNLLAAAVMATLLVAQCTSSSDTPTTLRPSSAVPTATAPLTSDPPVAWPVLGTSEEEYTLSLAGLGYGGGEPIEVEFAVPADEAQIRSLLFGEGGLAPGVVRARYPYLTMLGPIRGTSSGVTVFFIEDEATFYLLEDHMMGHMDPIIGPFDGDPRRQLAIHSAPTPSGVDRVTTRAEIQPSPEVDRGS